VKLILAALLGANLVAFALLGLFATVGRLFVRC
jgi:hypothetical protein